MLNPVSKPVSLPSEYTPARTSTDQTLLNFLTIAVDVMNACKGAYLNSIHERKKEKSVIPTKGSTSQKREKAKDPRKPYTRK